MGVFFEFFFILLFMESDNLALCWCSQRNVTTKVSFLLFFIPEGKLAFIHSNCNSFPGFPKISLKKLIIEISGKQIPICGLKLDGGVNHVTFEGPVNRPLVPNVSFRQVFRKSWRMICFWDVVYFKRHTLLDRHFFQIRTDFVQEGVKFFIVSVKNEGYFIFKVAKLWIVVFFYYIVKRILFFIL